MKDCATGDGPDGLSRPQTPFQASLGEGGRGETQRRQGTGHVNMQAATGQGGIPRGWKKQDGPFLRECWRERSPAHTSTWTSGLQDCEGIHFCDLKLPRSVVLCDKGHRELTRVGPGTLPPPGAHPPPLHREEGRLLRAGLPAGLQATRDAGLWSGVAWAPRPAPGPPGENASWAWRLWTALERSHGEHSRPHGGGLMKKAPQGRLGLSR